MTMTRNLLKRRIAVARGLEPGDVVLKNCQIVDVYTQTIRPGDIVIADGIIAGVGGPYEGQEVIDAHGAYAAPGLIESHIHIESSYVSPEEFGRLVVPLGTTTIVADPHEIVNVCGLAGLRYMMEAAEKTALDVRFMVPSWTSSSPPMRRKSPSTATAPASLARTCRPMRRPRSGRTTNVSPWTTSKRASRPACTSCCATVRPAMTCQIWSGP